MCCVMFDTLWCLVQVRALDVAYQEQAELLKVRSRLSSLGMHVDCCRVAAAKGAYNSVGRGTTAQATTAATRRRSHRMCFGEFVAQ